VRFPASGRRVPQMSRRRRGVYRPEQRYMRKELVGKLQRTGFEILHVTSSMALLLPLLCCHGQPSGAPRDPTLGAAHHELLQPHGRRVACFPKALQGDSINMNVWRAGKIDSLTTIKEPIIADHEGLL
jgi:hypothetical protein